MEEVTFGYKRFSTRDLQKFMKNKGLPGDTNYLFPVVGQALPEDICGRTNWELKFTSKHANAIFDAVRPYHLELQKVETALKEDPSSTELKDKKIELMRVIAESCKMIDGEYGFENGRDTNK